MSHVQALQPPARPLSSRRRHRGRRLSLPSHLSTGCRSRVSAVSYRTDLGGWVLTCEGWVPESSERSRSRVVVNLTPDCWSTSGKVRVTGGPSVEAVRVVGSRDAGWDPSLVGWFLCVPSLRTPWLRILALEDHSDDPDWVDEEWPYVMWVERGVCTVARRACAYMIAPGGRVRPMEAEPGRFVSVYDRMDLLAGDLITWL